MTGGQLFSATGEHAGLRFDVAVDRPAGTAAEETGEYRWVAWTAGCAVLVTAAAATTVPDRLTAEHLGAPGRGISVEVPRDGAAKPFAITIQAAAGGHPRLPHVRQCFFDEMTIVAGQRVSLRIDDGGAELLAINHGPPALCCCGSARTIPVGPPRRDGRPWRPVPRPSSGRWTGVRTESRRGRCASRCGTRPTDRRGWLPQCWALSCRRSRDGHIAGENNCCTGHVVALLGSVALRIGGIGVPGPA
ncbi:MAG TPA: hypothetical protein VES60_09075, partial [Nakamurella sp.]|nr:hypothetical protein [Nakamurella sp.]